VPIGGDGTRQQKNSPQSDETGNSVTWHGTQDALALEVRAVVHHRLRERGWPLRGECVHRFRPPDGTSVDPPPGKVHARPASVPAATTPTPRLLAWPLRTMAGADALFPDASIGRLY